ncbi:MAG: hypothetical protein HC807_01680, partial [Gammaproteobacteria bacterium]|nr:hypothetical protein [Gammaproteobacteria bacterium]
RCSRSCAGAASGCASAWGPRSRSSPGANDPMAVFLTLSLIDIIALGEPLSAWGLIGDFLWDLGLGAVGGMIGGAALAALLKRVRLSPGLAPLFVSAAGVCIFALVNAGGGSGLLAVYLTGIVVGNSRPPGLARILSVHDGLAWLMQIGMFLILGLLVEPMNSSRSRPRRSASRRC